MPMKRKVISEPLLESTVLWIYGGDEAKAQAESLKWFAERGVESLEASDEITFAHGRVFRGEKLHYVLWVARPEDRGVLQHEITHVAIEVFEYIGTEISGKTSELFCRYVEYLTNNVAA